MFTVVVIIIIIIVIIFSIGLFIARLPHNACMQMHFISQ